MQRENEPRDLIAELVESVAKVRTETLGRQVDRLTAALADRDRELAELRAKIAALTVGRGSWCFGGEWAPGAISVVELAEVVGFDVPPAPSRTLTPAEVEELRSTLDSIRAARVAAFGSAPTGQVER